MKKPCNILINRYIYNYQQDLNKNIFLKTLKRTPDEEMRFLYIFSIFIKKMGHFNLKLALFAEKERNKFAYVIKWNKFVFNNDIYV